MTIDAQFKKLGEDNIKIMSHTRDSCDKENLITVTSTTDGDVLLNPGQTKYFQIRRFDSYSAPQKLDRRLRYKIAGLNQEEGDEKTAAAV